MKRGILTLVLIISFLLLVIVYFLFFNSPVSYENQVYKKYLLCIKNNCLAEQNMIACEKEICRTKQSLLEINSSKLDKKYLETMTCIRACGMNASNACYAPCFATIN